MLNLATKALKPLLIGLSFNTMLALQGCSFFTPYKAPLTQGTIINQESLETLQAGLTKNQVRDLLGPPLGQDVFLPNRWEYVFYTTEDKLKTDLPNYITVVFDDEQYLESWEVKHSRVDIGRD